jgi:hypothetical protein
LIITNIYIYIFHFILGNVPSARFSLNPPNPAIRNNNGEAINRTKSESAVLQTNKRLINNNSCPPVKSNQSLTIEVINSKVLCMIDEYLINFDIKEVIDSLKELPLSSIDTYIEIVIKRYIGANHKSKDIVRSKLLSLLENSISLLLQSKDSILKCLKKNEYVTLLHESIMDNKDTPELLGQIIKLLIKTKSINFESFNTIINSVRLECSKDEYFDMKDIDAIYDRLIKSSLN